MPIGTTIVTCAATDGSNSSDTASFAVTVRDTTPPLVTAPASITIDATQSNGATSASSAALARGSLAHGLSIWSTAHQRAAPRCRRHDTSPSASQR